MTSMAKFRLKPAYIPIGILVALWLFVCIAPFYFMIMTSLKSLNDYSMSGFFSFPKNFMLSNYLDVLSSNFYRYFINSILVLALSLVILLAISSFAAYPFSRFTFKLNKPLFFIVVACMALPIHVTLIPIYLLTKRIGIYDSIFALIGPYIAFNLPISIFIVTVFMRGIPVELEEAAEIDGCGKFRTFFSIIFPMAKSGIATIAIYDSIAMWNEFSFVLVLTQSVKSRTLPLSIWDYQGQYTSNVPMIFTVLVLSVIPMIIAFIIGQDKLIKGMIAGAIKG
jgi:raffinose/stachyose/melibiose transport system permease protein